MSYLEILDAGNCPADWKQNSKEWQATFVSSLKQGVLPFMVATRFAFKSLDDVVANSNAHIFISNQSTTVWWLFEMYLLEKIERNEVLTPASKNRSLLYALLNSPEVANAINSQITECYTVYRDDFFNDPRKILVALANLVSKYDRKRRGDVRTPLKLVDEIVDKVDEQAPEYDAGVIDPACGNGSFLIVVQERVNNAPIVGVDINPRRAYIASALLNPYNSSKNVEIYCENFLEDSVKRWTDRKFGLALGNPPFQTVSARGQALWPFFVKSSINATIEENGKDIDVTLIKDDGLVALVLPNRFGLPGSNIRENDVNIWKTYIKPNQILVCNLGECERYFPGIGTAPNYFGYFIIKKSPPKEEISLVITKQGQFNINLNILDALPQFGDKLVFDIFLKVQNWIVKNQNLQIRRAHTGKDITRPKFCIVSAKNISFNQAVWIDSVGNAEWNFKNYSWDVFPPLATEESVRSVLKSKIYNFLFDHLVQTNISQASLHLFPLFDLTKVWTDKEIFVKLKLTEEEQQYILDNLK